MRVLIGVDGSPASYSAVEFVGRLLSADKDEILLSYSPPKSKLRRHSDSDWFLEPVQLYLADAVFKQAREHLPEFLQPKALTVACAHEPREGLLLLAADRCADLLVIGARGTGPLNESMLGSVARHVVDHATIPVLVVRNRKEPLGEPLRVLLASDGSQTSRHASEMLHRFSWPPKTCGLTLTVVEPEAADHLPEWLAELLDDQQLAALGMGHFESDSQHEGQTRKEAAKWYGKLPTIFAGREPIVEIGHAGQKVLAAIRAHEIDLVVVGARRLGPIQRLLLGSTSSQVVVHAPCSVLIIRAAER